MTTVYDYIAKTNPQGAKSLCESFGYRVTNPNTMSQNLKSLVNNEGEDAVKSLMQLHPDKDIILEFFASKKESNKNDNCGCSTNTGTQKMLEQYLNVSGKQEQNETKALVLNTNTIIFASALLLSVAIIFKK